MDSGADEEPSGGSLAPLVAQELAPDCPKAPNERGARLPLRDITLLVPRLGWTPTLL